MTAQELTSLLVQHGECVKDGNTLRVPADQELSLFAAVGNEALIIDRVAVMHLEAAALVAVTGRHERYLLRYDDVCALRLSPAGAGPGY